MIQLKKSNNLFIVLIKLRKPVSIYEPYKIFNKRNSEIILLVFK